MNNYSKLLDKILYKHINDDSCYFMIMQGINEKCPHIKTVVIDTLNGIMVADEMRRSKEKGLA